MNGAHDMGGVMGFGPVVAEQDEPVFHAEWERRVRGMVFAMNRPAGINIDMGRFARENRAPGAYLSESYYEIWLAGVTRLLIDRGFVTPQELAAGHALQPPTPCGPVVQSNEVAPILAKGRSSQRTSDQSARFAVADRVRARNLNPVGHTRLPRYVRGRQGVVTHLHGVHVFPDVHATGQGEAPQWLYTVRFSGAELWGDAADPAVTVSVDAWESYLEPCS